MANFNDAFQPENGINLDDLVGIFAGSIDPSTVGEVAPVGSLFVRSLGLLYQKIGAGDTDWIVFSQGLGEAVKISSNDTNAGYLNAKLLVSSSLTKTIQNIAANENILLDLANVGTPGTYRSVTTNSKGQITAGTNPTTLAGYAITDAQPLDADLTSIAAQSGTGYLTRTGTNAWTTRFFGGTVGQISVTQGNGVGGNTTISMPSIGLTLPGTEGVIVPIGTTAQRANATGRTRFNSTTSRLEYFNGTVWVELVASTGGTVTSVSVTPPAAGITVTGGPITTTGTFTFDLANDLAGIENLSGTGFSTRIATDTWATRILSGTTDRLSIIDGDGIAGNPTFDIASTYVGQTSITTLGVIGTGTWQGTTVGTAFGGTGRTTIGSANQVLGVNSTGTGLDYKSIVPGTGISVGFAGNQITISNAGVTSIIGTANQVIASASTGIVSLSLPQSIGTSSSPTFAQVSVAADPTSALQVATKQYVDAVAQGINAKDSVRVATTGVITLSGLQTIDGVAVQAGDRVLVRAQGLGPITNGIYIASAGAWTRAPDADTWSDLVSAFVFVEEGTTWADTGWLCQADAGGVIDTNFVFWVQFSSVGVIEADFGLTKSGNLIFMSNIGTAGTYNNVTTNARGQVVSGTNVAYLTANQNITLQGDVSGTGTTLINVTHASTGVTAGTYRSVTVDVKGRVTAGTNPTTLAGYGITDAQPLNAFLTSNAALSTNGIVVRNGNTALTRSIVAGSSKISITNGDGTAGNPTVDAVEANFVLNNISGILNIAKGGTGLSSTGTANQILSTNTAGTALEYRTVSAGTGVTITPSSGTLTIAATNNGTVTSVAATGSTGLTIAGGPITTSGTLTFTLGTELQGLSSLAALGIVTRTAAGTYTSRSIVSGIGTIAITNPLGTAGNIALDLSTVGTAGTYRSVTTDAYGRVTAGTNPTTLAGYGITDAQPVDATLTSLAAFNSNGFVVQTAADTFVSRSIDAGTGISIVNGTGVSGNPTITNTGVTSVVGTANRITVSGSTGAVTFSTPQDIHAGATPTFAQVTVAADPTTALGVATKQYVDNAITGLDVKQSVRVASTANITLSGTQTIDGVAVIAGDRVLVKDQTTGSQNGIYVVQAGAWIRSTDADVNAEVTSGLYTFVSEGTANVDTGWQLTTNDPITVGTTSLTFAQFTGLGQITAGNGLTKTGAVLDVVGAAGRIVSNVDNIDLATVGTAGTYQVVTTDAYGRVTSGSNPTTLAGFGITDAQPVDADLTALAALGTTGIMVRTGAGTASTRTLTAPAAGFSITNPDGVSGNPTFALTNDLAAVEGLSTVGFAVRTAADTWTTRTFVAGSGITLSNTDGVSGNITISAGGGSVTSVGLALPSIFTVSGSPVTSTGTLTAVLASQTAGTVFAGPVSGSGVPTFRTLGIDELSDVTITSPQNNQVLAYNSGTSQWVNTGAVGANAAGLVGVGQAGAAAWVLMSGTRYRADFAHNLGTTNVVITVFDSTSNAVIIPALMTLTNNNTVRLEVIGNTRTLRVVVVANGQSIVSGGSTPSSIITAKDGVTVTTGSTRLNFIGQAVSVADAGSGTANITIGARYSYFANSLDTPNNNDFPISALAPVTVDPSFPSLNVRSFSFTVEQGVGFTCSIPPGATQVTIKTRGRSQVGAFGTTVVQPRLYYRHLPNNTAVPAWSAAQELANITFPSNVFFQYAQQTIALSTLGLVADRLYQFEFTRRIAGVTGTNNPSNYLLAELTLEFA